MNIPWRKRREGGGPPPTLRQEFDDLVGRFLSEEDWLASRLPGALRGRRFPAVDLAESTRDFCVRVELPGLEEDDIQLELVGKQLVVSGERRWKEEQQEREFHRVEMYYGPFQRSVPLPEGLDLDPDAIPASYAKGILTVRIPKLEPTPPRRIRVRAEEEGGHPSGGYGMGREQDVRPSDAPPDSGAFGQGARG